MKRIIAVALTLTMAFGLVACGSTASSEVTSSSSEVTSSENTSSSSEAESSSEAQSSSEAESTDTAEGEVNAYAQIIANARDAELNQYLMIAYPNADATGFTAVEGNSGDFSSETELSDNINNMTFPMLGFAMEDATDMAFSISNMMTQAYGIAIVMPAEGKTDAVVAGLEAFVEGQKNSMNNYLMDQYEIASAATVTVAPTGEVILVCSENGEEILANIEAALAE